MVRAASILGHRAFLSSPSEPVVYYFIPPLQLWPTTEFSASVESPSLDLTYGPSATQLAVIDFQAPSSFHMGEMLSQFILYKIGV